MNFSNFNSDEIHGYQDMHKKDTARENNIEEEDEIVEVINDDHPQRTMDVYVRCRNRMDASYCLNAPIVYPKTFRDWKSLTDRLERIASLFIEKHENCLPECNLSEMIDKFVLLHELMSA